MLKVIFSSTAFKVEALVWYKYWLGRRNFQYKRTSVLQERLFQSNMQCRDGSKYPTFTVTILNTKETDEIEYNPKATLVEYH